MISKLQISLNHPKAGTAIVWIAFFAIVLSAWAALFFMTMTSPLSGVPRDLWRALCGGAIDTGLGALFAMWLIMAAAMMMPTFVPTLRVLLDLKHAGAARPTEALALVIGYGAIWVGGSLIGAVAQRFLAGLGLLAPDGSSLSLGLTAALLLGAAIYQFTPAKAACLARCRMPLTYFMERWAPGLHQSLRMGLHLGVYCLGCCWAMMALAFVGGTMNLIWMGVATLFMVLEKLPEIGRPLTRPAGALLLAASGLVMAMALTS